jgi:hypothetical protein
MRVDHIEFARSFNDGFEHRRQRGDRVRSRAARPDRTWPDRNQVGARLGAGTGKQCHRVTDAVEKVLVIIDES